MVQLHVQVSQSPTLNTPRLATRLGLDHIIPLTLVCWEQKNKRNQLAPELGQPARLRGNRVWLPITYLRLLLPSLPSAAPTTSQFAGFTYRTVSNPDTQCRMAAAHAFQVNHHSFSPSALAVSPFAFAPILSLHLGQSLHLRQGIPKKRHAEHSPRPGSHPQPRRYRFRGCRRCQRPTSCKLYSCLTRWPSPRHHQLAFLVPFVPPICLSSLQGTLNHLASSLAAA